MMFRAPAAGSADRDGGGIADDHPECPVTERDRARKVGADIIAQDCHSGRGSSLDDTPDIVFAEITLPAPAVVPPIVVPGAPLTESPSPVLPSGLSPGLVRPDVVILDQSAGRAVADINAVSRVRRNDVVRRIVAPPIVVPEPPETETPAELF